MNKEIKWTNNSPLLDEGINPKASVASFMYELTANKIKRYVESQIKEFLKENKIPEKRWLKRGVIQSLPPELSGQSYIFYYKTWRRDFKIKIKVSYNIVTGG